MTGCGLTPVRDTAEETELSAARGKEISEAVDPFLLEKTVVVTVRGREFAGDQRAVIEMKVARLRREFEDAATREDRRAAAGKMLRDLEEGLSSTLDVRTVERRFRPAVSVKDPVASIGRVVPIRPGSRIVYSVAAVKPEPGDDAEAEPMVFHVVGLGAREAVLLYTGGVHGQRHLRDLEDSTVHHAWFANRERVKTEATAPWIGRKLYRGLVENGCGEMRFTVEVPPGAEVRAVDPEGCQHTSGIFVELLPFLQPDCERLGHQIGDECCQSTEYHELTSISDNPVDIDWRASYHYPPRAVKHDGLRRRSDGPCHFVRDEGVS